MNNAGNSRHVAALVAMARALAVILCAAYAGSAEAGAARSAGTLDLQAQLTMTSQLGECPPGVSGTDCAVRTGEGLVPGLGGVTESYTFLLNLGPPCAVGFGKALAYSVPLVVAGKGEIDIATAEGPECVDQEAVRTQTQRFSITGGTGIYAGASGSGTVERILSGLTPSGRRGTETWTGTLAVPGLDFDVTPPTLSGAVSKTIRAARGAERARVRYAVTALDDIDSAVPVSCTPRSGGRFPIGRTRVTCSATDKSGNRQTARFTIIVKRHR